MKYLAMLMVFVSVCFGSARSRYEGDSAIIKASENSNSLVISDTTNPESAYDSLIARGDMGTLSSTNRRTLILMPGTYTLTGIWELDTDYVDVTGQGASPNNVIITRGTGGSTVTQTASDVCLSNLSITNAGTETGDHGFLIAATTNNDASFYYDLNFPQVSSKYYYYGVFATSDLGGTWYNCTAYSCGWRCALNKNLSATMYYCSGGGDAFQGDNENSGVGTGVLSGNLYHCTGGNLSFAGCGEFGASITGTLEDCVGGSRSFATGKTISGTLRRCRGDYASFAATVSTSYYGSITGVLEDCIAGGSSALGYSFATYTGAGCSITGRLVNCRNGTDASDKQGISHSYVTSIGTVATATLSTSLTGNNNDITYTSVLYGSTGNSVTIRYTNTKPTTGLAVQASGTAVQLWWKSTDATPTANDIITALNGSATAKAIVSFALKTDDPSGNDGTGEIVLMSPTALTGGADPGLIENCHPTHPTRCTVATTISYIDNGQTYNNSGAAGSVTVTLPTPRIGFKYKFAVVTAQTFVIEPGSVAIQKNLNTATTSAGDYISSATVGDWIQVESLDGATWTCTGASQAWTEE